MKLLIFGLTIALVSGCARDVTTGPGSDYPSGADQLVLRVETEGGFVPVDYRYRNVPSFSLMGDGSIVITGPQIEIYPPPALANLLTAKLKDKGVEAVLKEADEAGLMKGDQNFSNDRVADAPTTVITVNAGGKTHTTRVYALGFDSGPRGTDRIQKFINDVDSLVGGPIGSPSWMPKDAFAEPEKEYEMTRLQIAVFPASLHPEGDVDSGQADWPLGTPLQEIGTAFVGGPEAGRCAVVEGDDLAQLLPLVQNTNQLTRWKSGEDLFVLASRPLIPDEEGCWDELRDATNDY